MTILCRPWPLGVGARDLNTWAAARPSLSAVSAVTGSTFATPRTPSVPNSLRSVVEGFTGKFLHPRARQCQPRLLGRLIQPHDEVCRFDRNHENAARMPDRFRFDRRLIQALQILARKVN